jgi:hypothetical protein
METLITLITVLTTFIVAIISLYKTIKQGNKIQELHLIVNSRLSELLKLTEKSSYAEGAKSELDKK